MNVQVLCLLSHGLPAWTPQVVGTSGSQVALRPGKHNPLRGDSEGFRAALPACLLQHLRGLLALGPSFRAWFKQFLF